VLKHGEANPLDVFGLRQLDFCPPHFEIIVFDLHTELKNITDWIYENLSGRFYVGQKTTVDEGDPDTRHTRINIQKMAGFERHEEASYFGLFLPTINVSDRLW